MFVNNCITHEQKTLHVSYQAMASVDATNVQAQLRISTLELQSHNPIRECLDCHTDRPDPVWVMLKKATRLV